MQCSDFHRAVGVLLEGARARTPEQARARPAIRSGGHALAAAPTGSGRTLAAFLAAIDAPVRELRFPGDIASRRCIVQPGPRGSEVGHRMMIDPAAVIG